MRSRRAWVREVDWPLVIEQAVDTHTAVVEELHLGNRSAAIVQGRHVRERSVHHHQKHPCRLQQRRCGAMRRVADRHLVNAALVELGHEPVWQRHRHARLVELAPHHHRWHTARSHIVYEPAGGTRRVTVGLPGRLPVWVVNPRGQLGLLPLVERLDPLVRISDSIHPSRHIAVAVEPIGTVLPGASNEPAVQEQGVLVNERQLAELEKLAHAPTRPHALQDRQRHLVFAQFALLYFAQQCLLGPLPVELAISAHRLLVHPPNPIRQGVCTVDVLVLDLVDLAVLLLCEHFLQKELRIHALCERHPQRSGHILAPIVLGRGIEFRHEPQLVEVAVAEKENDSVGISALKPTKRAHHTHRTADYATLVAGVTTMDDPPALLEHQVGSAVVIEHGITGAEAERLGRAHKAFKVFPIALDVGDERHIGRQ
eukprot:3379376-Prymnesium_polylepis.2